MSLVHAKAYAATIGAGISAAVAFAPTCPHWLAIVGVALTGAATYRVPNAAPSLSVGDGPYVPDLTTATDPVVPA